ncbi:MAG: hypothetical protein CM1200mP10_12690 [Candidatus Neomarinimicrobiota bacterium]|nr:MAG: hypothetical protein CM1200mP10_12690 [Candidatus Neomarinimicrobiota bacterium]
MIEIKQYISEVIHAGLAKLKIKENFLVENQKISDFGDFSSNIARGFPKTAEKPPRNCRNIQSELKLIKKSFLIIQLHNQDF